MRKGDLNRDQYLILARPAVQNWTEFKTNFDLNGDGATQITADPSSKSTLNSDQVWTSLVQRDLNGMVCLLQQVTKRHLRRSKSLVSVMLWGGSEEFESDKAKNVRQTEILVDLREAILQVARHFQSIDPKNSRVVCISVSCVNIMIRYLLNSV